ncbi:alpha-tocopherol transfer protein-like [Periplaneta americana]|uniref:alpha-tocopherol transfer protein-like n=1 Tax=Periplaneta americana TaxID=6978 RepID=UPI0037E73FC4
MVLPPPSKEVLQRVREEFGLDEQGMKQGVQVIREWLDHQPHLPHDCDDARLERWIIRCKNSLERTKHSLDMYYSLKTVVPEMLLDRDPQADWFKTSINMGYTCPLSKLTKDLSRVIMLGCLNPDSTTLVTSDIVRASLMVQDIRMSEDYCCSDIYIMDFDKFTIGHFSKVTLPILKKIEVCSMKGYNVRIKGIHLVNVPPTAEVLIGLLKSVFKQKIVARIHIHTNGFKSLHDQISPDILPSELGGTNGSIIDHWSAWIKKMESYRDWFLEQDKMISDESKRPGKALNSGELFGIDGSFRKLNID